MIFKNKQMISNNCSVNKYLLTFQQIFRIDIQFLDNRYSVFCMNLQLQNL